MLDFIINVPLFIFILGFSFLFVVFYKRIFILFVFLLCFLWLILKISLNIQIFHLNSFFYTAPALLFLFVFIFSVNIIFIVNYCLPKMVISTSFYSRFFFLSLLRGKKVYIEILNELAKRFTGRIVLSSLEVLAFFYYIFVLYLKLLFLYLRRFYLGYFFLFSFFLFDSFLLALLISLLYLLIFTYLYSSSFRIDNFNIVDKKDSVFLNVNSIFNNISINFFEFASSRFIFLKGFNDVFWSKKFELQNGNKNNLYIYNTSFFKHSYVFYSVVLNGFSKFKSLITYLINLIEYYFQMLELFGENEATQGTITYKFSFFNFISSYLSNFYPNIFIINKLKSTDFDYDIERSEAYLIDFVDYSFFDHKRLTGNFNNGFLYEFSAVNYNIFDYYIYFPYFEDLDENMMSSEYNIHNYLDRFMSKYFGLLMFLNLYYVYSLNSAFMHLRFYYFESYIKAFGFQISSWFGYNSYIGELILMITGNKLHSDFNTSDMFYEGNIKTMNVFRSILYTTKFYSTNFNEYSYSEEEYEKIKEAVMERYSKVRKV